MLPSPVFAELPCWRLPTAAVPVRSDRFLRISQRDGYKCEARGAVDLLVDISTVALSSLDDGRKPRRAPTCGVAGSRGGDSPVAAAWPGPSCPHVAGERGFGESRAVPFGGDAGT